MPKFLIERNIPGVSRMTPADLRAAAQKSCTVLHALGPAIQWLHSYAAGDKLYCIYISPSEQLIRDHAARSGFPADRITPISTILDPSTADARPDHH